MFTAISKPPNGIPRALAVDTKLFARLRIDIP
jgi:hypothetical protein